MCLSRFGLTSMRPFLSARPGPAKEAARKTKVHAQSSETGDLNLIRRTTSGSGCGLTSQDGHHYGLLLAVGSVNLHGNSRQALSTHVLSGTRLCRRPPPTSQKHRRAGSLLRVVSNDSANSSTRHFSDTPRNADTGE
jgi:hypothetical protein